MEINYVANKTFSMLHYDMNPYLFVRGPVGSGKSSGCIMQLFMLAVNQQPDSTGVRNTRFAVIRSTYPALKTTVVKSWKDWFKDNIQVVYDVPIRAVVSLDLQDGTKVNMEIHFIALDREDNANKLQSLELTAAHINEAAEIPKGILDLLKTRVKRYPSKRDGGPTRSLIILDYNSVDIEHWLYQLAEEEQPPRHSFYSQPPAMLMCSSNESDICDLAGNYYKLNPDADNLVNLEDGYYEDMVAGADEDFINVFILNNYGALRKGRPVYKIYDDKVHALDKPIKPLDGIPIVIGMDVGLDPAAVFTQLSPTGRLIVLEELVSDNTSIQDFCDEYLWPVIRNKYKKFKFEIKVDPAAINRSANDKRSAREVIMNKGLPVVPARTNEPLARREAVNFFLRNRNGFILAGPDCRTLRKGFISEYKYGKKSSSNVFNKLFNEKPEKNAFSHVHDALQYAALELSSGRTIRKGIHTIRQRFSRPADSSAGY